MKKLHVSSFALSVLMCLGMALLPEAEASAPGAGDGRPVIPVLPNRNSVSHYAFTPSASVPQGSRLYILMYHHIVPEGSPCNPWTVTGARFREDLQWLADHGWTTVLPSQLAAGEALPPKAVMLTFDDGYRSNYELAYPLLQQFQAKAAISIVVDYTERQDPGFLTWDMCREMAQSGLVEIGSHTYASHSAEQHGILRLDAETRGQYEARVFPDLQASIDRIEERVGVRPSLFAYPNGRIEPWAWDFIREHFSVTVTTNYGYCDLSDGLYGLNRYNVSMGTPVSQFLPS